MYIDMIFESLFYEDNFESTSVNKQIFGKTFGFYQGNRLSEY